MSNCKYEGDSGGGSGMWYPCKPEGGGGGGSVSGNTASVNPPETSPCGHCWFGDFRAYSTRYGGGSGGQKHITIEGLEDFNRTLRSLGALIEDIAVSLDIARAARIQAITEGVSLQEWISQAIRMRLQSGQHGKQSGKTE